MLKKFNLCFLTLLASSGYALALLGAVSTLWPHTPTQQGLESFAFSLAAIMPTVFGNLLLFACHLVIGDRGEGKFLSKITAVFSAIVFMTGAITASVFFSEGLNAWFTTVPMMPASLILLFRLLILVPFLWLLILAIISVLSRRRDAQKIFGHASKP